MKRKTNVIALACHKGGVGKTTTAAALGGVFSLSEGGKVLLVDLDPQMNLTSTFTDGDFDRTVYDAMVEFRKKGRAELPIYNIRENLDIVPSQVDMCSIDSDFASYMLRNVMLKEMLDPVRDRYDWIFIDCPAQLGAIAVNALVAADSVLIPMTCDAYSIDGLIQITNFVEEASKLNPRLGIVGVAVTRFRQRVTTNRIVVDELAAYYGDRLFKTKVRECAAVSRAPLEKKDVYSYNRSCVASDDYLSLAGEIKERLGRRA